MLAALARRINVPYPALLALTGAALALLPGTPSVTLDPQLALALFVAPVLLDAAFDSSPRDLRQNWRAVTSLALIAVGLTVAAVAVAVRWVVPDMPWSVAIALGAIVAPPDAAAATAVLRQLRAPHRVFVILEGESLFNDASALLIYRLAVAATITGSFSGWSAIPMLVVVCAGSVLLGYLLLSPADESDASHHGRRDLGDRAVRLDLRRVDRCGTHRLVRHHHHGRLRHRRGAHRARPLPRTPPHPLVRRLGSRGLRAQRSRLHPGRTAAQADPAATQ